MHIDRKRNQIENIFTTLLDCKTVGVFFAARLQRREAARNRIDQRKRTTVLQSMVFKICFQNTTTTVLHLEA